MLESMNKKIVVLGDPIDNQNAGIHVYTRELVQAMGENNPQGYQLYLIREKITTEFEGFTQKAFPNIHLPIGYASLRLFFRIPAFLQKIKPDVVIEPAHFGPFNTPKGSKRVTVIHDLTPLKFPQWHRWHSQMLQKVFLPGILKRADLIIANSEYTKSDIVDWFPTLASKVEVVYPGINPAMKSVEKADCWKPKGLDRSFFLYAGTIEPRKRVDQLLYAYEMWRDQGNGEEQLVIAGGKGWKTNEFENALKKSKYPNDVFVTGFISDEQLSGLYSDCKLFIYPSAYEGFGFPVVEALSCGAKVLTAKNSSLIEVGGPSVSFFEEGQDIATKIYDSMNKALKKDPKIKEHPLFDQFDWKSAAGKYFELIEGL